MVALELSPSSPAQRNRCNSLLASMTSLGPLSPADAKLLEDMSAQPRSFSARAELQVPGVVQSPLLLLSGWACSHRLLGDGRRQIVSFILPGDAVGSLLNASLPTMCAAMALTPVTAIDARPLLSALDDGSASPALLHLVRLMALREDLALRDQVVRLGRQTAYERMVHLVLDFRQRLFGAGLTERNAFTLPLTQETLADALGLSVVHVNRTLQQIRRDGLLELRGGTVTLLQPERMEAIADWRPSRS